MNEKRKCPSGCEMEAWLDGRLDGQAKLAVEVHLQQCPGCRAEIESLSLAHQDLRLAAGLEPPPIDSARVVERLFATPGRHSRRLVAALAGAAALAALWLCLWPAGPERLSPPRQDWLAAGVVQAGPGELLFLPAPARARLTSGHEGLVVELKSGLVLVRLEGERARNFIVRTPAGDVAALGTVFSVEVGGDLAARVEMWRGKVELRPAGAAGALRLEAPGCARLATSGARPGDCSGLLAALIAEAENRDAGFAGLLAVVEPPPAGGKEPEARPATAASSAEATLEEEIGAVRRLLAQRSFARADRKLDELLGRGLEDARIYLLQCDSARLQEKLPQALAACQQAARFARERPQRELALYQQGRILLALGRPAEAEEVFGLLVQEFPQGLLRQESRYALLECLLAQEKYERAAESARAYLEAYPRGAGADEVRKVLEMLEEKGWK